MSFLVYKATHLPSGKIYVGRTNQGLGMRMHQHYTDVEQRQFKFQKFLNSTPMNEWTWQVLHEFDDKKSSIDCEMFYVSKWDLYKIGLNTKPGVKAGSQPSQLKDVCFQKGHAPWNKGRFGISEETSELMSLAKMRNPVRAKWTEDRKLEASKAYGKRIKCINDGLIFDSISKAAVHYGISREMVRDVVNGKRKQTAGLIFTSESPTSI